MGQSSSIQRVQRQPRNQHRRHPMPTTSTQQYEQWKQQQQAYAQSRRTRQTPRQTQTRVPVQARAQQAASTHTQREGVYSRPAVSDAGSSGGASAYSDIESVMPEASVMYPY